MPYKLLFIGLAVVLSGAFFVVPVIAVQNEAVDEARLEKIQQNCIAAQVALGQVQHSDIAVRINRGQAYDNMLTRLMAPFNAQAALDRLDVAPELAQTTNEFEEVFDGFKQEYAQYERALSQVTRMKCQDQPQTFYDNLTTVRELRAGLQEDVVLLQDLAKEYLTHVDTAYDEVTAEDEET